MAIRQKRHSRRNAVRPARRVAAPRRASRVHETLEQFRLAQQELGIVTWSWVIASDRVRWHGDASRLLGLPPKSFSGRFPDYLKLVHPADVAAARTVFNDCLKGRTAEYRTAERVRWPDGSLHWLETYGRAERAPNGRTLRMVGAIKEITARKRQESALRKAEALLGRVFDASPEYIIIVRAEDGCVLAANPAFERVTGYRAAGIVGRTVNELNIWGVPGERDRFLADLKKSGAVQNRLVLLRASGGKLLSGRMSASLIEHEGERLIVSLMHDVTDSKRLERRADQSERKFAALFATSPIGLVVTRPSERRIVEINDAALRMLGVERSEAIGASTLDIVRWENQASFVRRDGARVSVLMSGARVDLDGEAHFVISVLDVTEARRLERAAHAAERKFAALFENSPEPITLYRISDGARLAANAAWERVTGYSRDKATTRPATGMSMWRDMAERAEFIARVEREGLVSNVPQRLARADGTPIEALISGVCLEVEGERCILWNWRDITDQRRMERERREADARYRALFETALEGIFMTTFEGFIIDANPAGCAMSGFTREDLVGRHASVLYSEQELRERPIRVGGDAKWSVVERTMTRKDGGTLAVEVVGGTMPDGNVLAILRDITERKRNETLLMNVARGVSAELGEAFFRSLAEHMGRELGADFAFIGELVPPANDRVRTLAFLADGVITPNPDYPLAGSMSAEALKRGGTVVFERGVVEQFPRNSEMRRHAIQAYVGAPLYGADGKPIGVLAVANRKPIERGQFWASMIEIFGARAGAEIERERAEALVRRTNESLEAIVHQRTAQLEDANRELESYNFSISHDLRQPLNAIAGFAELLRDQVAAGGGDARQCVAEIEANAQRMEEMIVALLALSRAGRAELRRERVATRQLVDSVLGDLAASQPLGGEVTLGELPDAYGDPVLVRQVWANLIGNAVKYSRQVAAPRIEISGTRRGDAIEYAVRDNGVGFDMRHAERLFDAFQRLPSSAGFEGNGVGLAIVQRIVQRHRGSIEADSTPGAGSTFRFTLPDLGMTKPAD